MSSTSESRPWVTHAKALLVSAALAITFIVPASAQEFDRDALVEAARAEGKLVWYTGAPEALANAMLSAFNEKYPFIDVSEYYRQSAGRLQAKLQAEIDAGQAVADVLHSGDASVFLMLGDHLAEFVTPEQDAFPEGTKDAGWWTAWRLTALNLAYNPSGIEEADRPTSWLALTDPKFRGRIALQDSTAGLMHVQWLALRDTLGPDFWPKVGENQPVILAGSVPVLESVLRGENLLDGNATSYFLWQYGTRDGAPYVAANPTEGVPIAINPIAVLEDAPHPNAARLFVDWILSQEGQEVMVKAVGDYSARGDVAPPEGSLPLTDLKPIMPTSIETLAASKQEFLDQWRAFSSR